MNEQERRHIEYRPQLTYSRDLSYVARKFGLPPSSASDYQMPPELADVVSLPATGVLMDAMDVRGRVGTLVSDLLKGADLPGPVPLAEYLKAREEGDLAAVAAFEDFHSNELEGATQGEVVPLLLEIADEMEDLVTEIKTTFFLDDLKDDELEEAMAEEQAMLEALIAEDMKARGDSSSASTQASQDTLSRPTVGGLARPSVYDKQGLATRAQLLHASTKQIAAASSTLDRIEKVLKHTTNDTFKGNIRGMIGNLSAMPASARVGVSKMNELRFAQSVAKGRAILAQKRAFDGKTVRKKLWELIRELTRQWQESCLPVLQWLNSIDLIGLDGASTQMVENMLESIEQVKMELDDALLDLLKQTALDEGHRSKLLEAIGAKKEDRQTIALLDSMKEQFDFDDPDVQRQIRRLVENNGLEQPGTIFTR